MADTKISALTTITPAQRTTSDWLAGARGSASNWKLDASRLGVYARLQGLTVYTTRALAISGAADSGASIQTQLDALSTAGGGTALLDTGFYASSTYISVPSNVRLVGTGKGSTTLVYLAAATTDPVTAGLLVFLGATRASVESLTVDITSVAAACDGIVFSNATSVAAGTLMNYVTYAAAGAFTEGERIVGQTTGATGTVIYQNGTAGISLANIVGTFNGTEVIVGSLSGTSKTSTSAVTNAAAKACSALNCEVIGEGNRNNQYLIWLKMGEDITIADCTIDGKTVAESGANEFRLDNNGSMDQQGINVAGCYNVKITNNTVRNCILTGILLSSPNAICNHNEGVLVDGNTIESCSNGIYTTSDYTSSLANKVKDVLVTRNLILNCHKWGIRIASTTSAAVEQYSNVVFSENVVDLRGTKLDATNYGAYVLWVANGALTLVNGCKIVRNIFRGGGGKGSSTTVSAPAYINISNGWEIRGNTFDNVGNAQTVTASGACIRMLTSNDTVFADNVITHSLTNLLCMDVITCLRTTISGNTFRGDSTISMIQIRTSSHNTAFINNTVYATAGTNPTVFGDATTGTGFEYYGNNFVGSTKAFFDTLYPHIPELGTGTSVTQTHGFGRFSPDDGAASYTVTNGKVWKSSKIMVRQTAGTALAFKVSIADGSFVLTPSAVFAGTSSYQYHIIN